MEWRTYYVCNKCETWTDNPNICLECGCSTFLEYKASIGDKKVCTPTKLGFKNGK